MVIPPTPYPKPPAVPEVGDLGKGRKVDISDMMNIALGGFPGELLAGTAGVNETIFPEVPQGIHRIIQTLTADGDAVGQWLFANINRQDTDYEVGEGHVCDSLGHVSLTAKAFILKPGDILSVYDAAAAGNVFGAIMFVDVYV